MDSMTREGKYTRIRIIGSGSSSTVWLVVDAISGRRLAMKVIHHAQKTSKSDHKSKEIVLEGEGGAEALMECRVLCSLPPHPHNLTLLDHFMDDQIHGPLCLITPYAYGGDLNEFLKNTRKKRPKGNAGALCEGLIWKWTRQLASGLDHIHAHGIIHRDLKTKNVFLMPSQGKPIKTAQSKVDISKDDQSSSPATEMDLVIGDFGICRPLGPQELAKTAIGTPFYASPELLSGQGYDAKSDVWSLGCVVYELATLRHAFAAPSLPSLIKRVLRANFTPIRNVNYSKKLTSTVAWLLQVEPIKRPAANEIMMLAELNMGRKARQNVLVPARMLLDYPSSEIFRMTEDHQYPRASIFHLIERERHRIALELGGDAELIKIHQNVVLDRHVDTPEINMLSKDNPILFSDILRLCIFESFYD